MRELREGLSRHLAAVRAGQLLTVTDHGRPVARLVPVAGLTPLERLVASGRVQRPAQAKAPAPDPYVVADVSDLVRDQRR